MREVEVKVLEINQPELEKTLLSLGAVKVFEGDILAVTYDFPDGRLGASKSFLRLRTKGDQVEIVLKERLESSFGKSYEETEVTVSSFEVASKMLSKLGMVITRRNLLCHRVSYTFEGVHFEIDTVEGVPTFLEIEVSNEEELRLWVERLGYSLEDAKSWNKQQVCEYYGVVLPEV